MSARILPDLPIFPLRGLVFLPHTLLPLHIFEPRYRELTAWCLSESAPMAVTLIRPEADDESVVPVTGFGEIIHHERLPDGRYNILLRGLGRAQILEELPMRGLFRRVRAEIIPDQLTGSPFEQASRLSSLRALVEGLSAYHPEAAENILQLMHETPELPPVMYGIASLLYRHPLARQELLEDPCILPRADQLISDLAGLLARTSPPTAEDFN